MDNNSKKITNSNDVENNKENVKLEQNKVYAEPKKVITNNEKLKVFLEGNTIKNLKEFICALQKSVEQKSRFDTPDREVYIKINV